MNNDLNIDNLFGLSKVSHPTNSAFEIFKTLSTLYVGGGSIVDLKTPSEGFAEESKCMEQVNETMRKGNPQMSEISKRIKLGPDQTDIFLSRIGLSYILIAPWGGGKSMLLELELKRLVETHMETKEDVEIFLVVYEIKAIELLKKYQEMVKDIERTERISINVMNLAKICEQFSIQYANRYFFFKYFIVVTIFLSGIQQVFSMISLTG